LSFKKSSGANYSRFIKKSVSEKRLLEKRFFTDPVGFPVLSCPAEKLVLPAGLRIEE
jgi:hypothetical protein